MSRYPSDSGWGNRERIEKSTAGDRLNIRISKSFWETAHLLVLNNPPEKPAPANNGCLAAPTRFEPGLHVLARPLEQHLTTQPVPPSPLYVKLLGSFDVI